MSTVVGDSSRQVFEAACLPFATDWSLPPPQLRLAGQSVVQLCKGQTDTSSAGAFSRRDVR